MRTKMIKIVKEKEAWLPNVGTLAGQTLRFVDHLIANGVTIPVRCKDCKHWIHVGEGYGDCTHSRFHLDGHVDPTMKMNDFCSCGERKDNDGQRKAD